MLKHCLAGAALALSAGFASAQDIPAHIEAAVADERRTESNVERDGDRKPGEVLAYYGVEPGMDVLDLFSSGGYFTEVLAAAVGEEGTVYAHNRGGERFEESRSQLEGQYAPFGNIEMVVQDGDALPLGDDSVDLVLFSLILHHFHYDEENPEAMPARAEQLYSEVLRVLRPGGTFAVIEHVAEEGASREQSAAWHRIDRATAIEDITSAGFEYAGEAEGIHVNPDDDNANVWYETGLRGQTNRMVMTFQAPE